MFMAESFKLYPFALPPPPPPQLVVVLFFFLSQTNLISLSLDFSQTQTQTQTQMPQAPRSDRCFTLSLSLAQIGVFLSW